jgi:RNA-directed DNA polymerase
LPPSQTLNSFLNALAASLAHQPWQQAALEHHLRLRFPPQQSRAAASVATALKTTFPRGAAPDATRVARHLGDLPQIKRLWAHAQKHNLFPALSFENPRFLPDPALAELGLPVLNVTSELADWLAITPDQLIRFADLRGLSARSSDPFGPHYHHHLIPKRNGTLRLIEEPKPFLKRLQRRILTGLLNPIPPHDAAFGFRVGRNCIMAAARHASEAVIVGFDLADFFPAISYARVYAIFRTLGYPAATARTLAGLCTAVVPSAVLQTPALAAKDHLTPRHLPQGAPTSPALANLAALALDRRLAGLARCLGANYTRYADDLTFSGDARISRILMQAVPQIVTEQGFCLNATKTRISPQSQRQTVTGMTVNQRVNLPRPVYDRLRATLHHLTNPADPRRHDRGFLAQLSGQIAWAEQINPARAARLRAAFHAVTNP